MPLATKKPLKVFQRHLYVNKDSTQGASGFKYLFSGLSLPKNISFTAPVERRRQGQDSRMLFKVSCEPVAVALHPVWITLAPEAGNGSGTHVQHTGNHQYPPLRLLNCYQSQTPVLAIE